jgi:hypothetical protein
MKKTINILGAGAMLCALSIPSQSQAADYPTAINERPLTLPGGVWSASAGLAAGADFSAAGLAAGFGYGINDKMDVGLSWGGMAILPDVAIDKSIGLGVGYALMNDGPMTLAAALSIPLNFNGGDVASGVGIGAPFRYNLMDGGLSIHTGGGLIGLNVVGDLAMSINVPLGIAYQVNENMNVRLDTHLATIGVIGGGGVTSIADATPVNLTFAYSMDKSMDIGVSVGGDVQAIGDTMALGLGLSYRGF